jgi:hypothetical protein
MKRSNTWLALPLVLVLAACAGDAEEGEDASLVEDPQEVLPPAQEPGLNTPPGTQAGTGETSAFQALQNSGVTGEATITDRGQQTQVMVRLTGTEGGGEHPGHIHTGTCDNIGGVVQPLQPVTTDSTGTGSMTADVEIAPMAAMDGQHVVVYHAAGGGPPITCAAIPMHRM